MYVHEWPTRVCSAQRTERVWRTDYDSPSAGKAAMAPWSSFLRWRWR
jgi:hypothetical protein